MDFAAPRSDHLSRALCGACGAAFDASGRRTRAVECPLCRTSLVRDGIRRLRRRVPHTRAPDGRANDDTERRTVLAHVSLACVALLVLALAVLAVIDVGPHLARLVERIEAEQSGIPAPR